MKPPPGFGKGVTDYLNHYVSVADTKAAGVLTVDLALAGYLLTQNPAVSWSLWFHWIALLLLLASGGTALVALYPRTPRIGSSLIFWEDVCSRATLEVYLKDLSQADEAEVERQYGAQNHIVSGILKRKYKAVRWAMSALMGALPATVLKLIIGA